MFLRFFNESGITPLKNFIFKYLPRFLDLLLHELQLNFAKVEFYRSFSGRPFFTWCVGKKRQTVLVRLKISSLRKMENENLSK